MMELLAFVGSDSGDEASVREKRAEKERRRKAAAAEEAEDIKEVTI